ncbi:hypothetical protein IKW75_02900 [Candidatus Saccharibacteria bacterium]|nr:hypothetical protein [Candidatus Saccharibacteria bacterium]
MQLIKILLIAVSILTLLSGVSVLSGARKGERLQAFIFFFTTIACLAWATSIAVFLALPEGTSENLVNGTFFTIYISAIVMCWGLMSYTCHKYILGKICMILFAIIGGVLAGFIIYNPHLMYSSIELSATSGNIVHLHQNLFYLLFGAYFCVTVLLYMIGLLINAKKAATKNAKRAYLLVLTGFTITGIIALIFNLILPVFGKYDTIWIGPLAMCIAWVFHYYAILRYHLINLSGRWLKVFSHIIIMSFAAIIYLAIFFIVFTTLFKVPSPSTEVVVLVSIIIIVALLLFPVLSEISDYVRSLASVRDVDIVYIVKKLNSLSSEYLNYDELSGFLADHLHFQSIGLIIDGKLYDSAHTKLSTAEITRISGLRSPARGIWIALSDTERKSLKRHEIESVAVLRDGDGKVVGKVLFGRPMGNIPLSSRHLLPIETALTMTASAISAEQSPKK